MELTFLVGMIMYAEWSSGNATLSASWTKGTICLPAAYVKVQKEDRSIKKHMFYSFVLPANQHLNKNLCSSLHQLSPWRSAEVVPPVSWS